MAIDTLSCKDFGYRYVLSWFLSIILDITQGVPRIKEIINGAKRISTPIITVELEHNSNVNAARIIKGRIQKTVLGQVCNQFIVET
jgi:hypothetical protein